MDAPRLRRIALSLLFVLVALIFLGGSRQNASDLFAGKINRCTLEDFILNHRILYHFSMDRADVDTLNLLCKKASEIQINMASR